MKFLCSKAIVFCRIIYISAYIHLKQMCMSTISDYENFWMQKGSYIDLSWLALKNNAKKGQFLNKVPN